MTTPILNIQDLHVYYGGSHVLQGVSMVLDRGMTAIIGRNGMGKTTLVKAVMGLVPAKEGKVFLAGEDITGLPPYRIARKGIGYVPQGRKIFPSLTVDEHLRFAARPAPGGWDAERVYAFFPRLKERYKQSGTNLSGGEQQMLAIGRALVTNPKLLIMDEPSEGLAPVIVDQLIDFCRQLQKTDMALVLVEQDLTFARAVSEQINVMLTGRFAYQDSFDGLMADRELTHQLIGVG